MLVHVHHIVDAFAVSIICISVYIIAMHINIISKRDWRTTGFVTMGLVIITTLCFFILQKYSEKANADSFKYVQLILFKEKSNINIRCEENAKRAFELFSEHPDIKAITSIEHFPVLGRHIFLVKSDDIKPFVVDMSVSYRQRIFVWIHLEKEWEGGPGRK